MCCLQYDIRERFFGGKSIVGSLGKMENEMLLTGKGT